MICGKKPKAQRLMWFLIKNKKEQEEKNVLNRKPKNDKKQNNRWNKNMFYLRVCLVFSQVFEGFLGKVFGFWNFRRQTITIFLCFSFFQKNHQCPQFCAFFILETSFEKKCFLKFFELFDENHVFLAFLCFVCGQNPQLCCSILIFWGFCVKYLFRRFWLWSVGQEKPNPRARKQKKQNTFRKLKTKLWGETIFPNSKNVFVNDAWFCIWMAAGFPVQDCRKHFFPRELLHTRNFYAAERFAHSLSGVGGNVFCCFPAKMHVSTAQALTNALVKFAGMACHQAPMNFDMYKRLPWLIRIAALACEELSGAPKKAWHKESLRMTPLQIFDGLSRTSSVAHGISHMFWKRHSLWRKSLAASVLSDANPYFCLGGMGCACGQSK